MDKDKNIFIGYQVLLAMLGAVGLLFEFTTFGISCVRVFSTWVLLISLIYFTISAIFRKFLSPMFLGMILVGFFVTSYTVVRASNGEIGYDGLNGLPAALIYGTMPVFVLADWLIFAPRGIWRSVEPFFFLALPACYAATIIFTAEFMEDGAYLRYPVEFLDYNGDYIFTFLLMSVFYLVVILLVGYSLFVIDAIMSGKVGETILMPKLKIVEVEVPPEPEVEIPAPKPKTATKKSTSAKKKSPAKKSQPKKGKK